MTRLLTATLLILIAATPATADYDAEMEKREAIQREAAQRSEEAKKRDMQRMMKEQQEKANSAIDKQMMGSKRESLGTAANGKSDTEVNRLYDAKLKADTENTNRTIGEGRKVIRQGDGAKALKDVTGKSLLEMENLSDAEAEALMKEMEKKYGK